MADIIRYTNLVTSQHQNKPKFMAWLTAALNPIDDGATLANNLNTYFDIDTAIGKQLDILGEVIGVGRTVNFQPSGGVSPVLDDDTYRIVLKAKIMQNQWDGTIGQIYELWSALFGSTAYMILQDNQDMTLIAQIFGLSSTIQQDLISNGYIVPRPEGVTMNYLYITNPVFSYDMETTYYKGYDEGYWGQFF